MIACFNSLRFGGDGWRERGLGGRRFGFLRRKGQKGDEEYLLFLRTETPCGSFGPANTHKVGMICSVLEPRKLGEEADLSGAT